MFGNTPNGHDARTPAFHETLQVVDARHAAWSVLTRRRDGIDRQASHVRPHRGQLADVDFTRFEPDPGYVPPLRRIGRLFGRLLRRGPMAGANRSADGDGSSPDLRYSPG